MFILTQYLLKNFLSSQISENSLPTYTVVIGLVIYALFYSYFLIYNRDLLPFFNKIIIYVIGVDLLVSAFYNYNIQLQNTHLNDNQNLITQNLEHFNAGYNLIQHEDNEDDEIDDDETDEDETDDEDNDDISDDENEETENVDIENNGVNIHHEENDTDIDNSETETLDEKNNENVSNDTTLIDLNNHYNESLNQKLNDLSNINNTNETNNVNENLNDIFTKQISEQTIKKRGRPAKNKN
jgi:hypothetical protein